MAGGAWWVHGMGMFCEAYVMFSVGNLGGEAAAASFSRKQAGFFRNSFFS